RHGRGMAGPPSTASALATVGACVCWRYRVPASPHTVDWLAFKGFIVHFSIIPRRRSRAPRYRVARDHGLPALRDVHLLVNVLHRDDFSSGSNPATEKGEIDPATAAASPGRR